MRRNAQAISYGTGYEKVDSQVMCVVTRFEVRSLWALLRFYGLFRYVRAQSRDIPGLLASTFLIENRRTCYTMSLWRNEAAILQFNTQVIAHIHAANSCFRNLATTDRRPRLWSAQFKLFAVSSTNLRWEGVEVIDGSALRAATNATPRARVAP